MRVRAVHSADFAMLNQTFSLKF
eukprot:COSAG06_NODE_6237_length_3024_cov_1.304615_4_plen_22_part_01